MKLSFSTKGWEGYSWPRFCDKAEELGFCGIEIHDMHHPAFTGRNAVFDPAMIRATYRRLSERGVLKNENTIVSSLISKEQAQKSRLEEMVEETFEGSMPAFIAAFSKTKKLTRQEVDQLKALIDSFEEE